MLRSVRSMPERATGAPVNSLVRALNRSALQHLTHDGALLFLSRFTRLFSYGALSVVLVFYLTGIGLSESQTGLLLTLTLFGDTAVSLMLTTQADRIGRRRMLFIGAILMAGAGLAFALTQRLPVPGSRRHDRHYQPERKRSRPFHIYRASGPVSSSSRGRVDRCICVVHAYRSDRHCGRLPIRRVAHSKPSTGCDDPAGERTDNHPLVCGFGTPPRIPFQPGLLCRRSTSRCRRHRRQRSLLGVGSSRGVVFRLSGLFALDAFGGGFVIQSFAAYWFYLRFGVSPATLGGIFFGANVLAGVSA